MKVLVRFKTVLDVMFDVLVGHLGKYVKEGIGVDVEVEQAGDMSRNISNTYTVLL